MTAHERCDACGFDGAAYGDGLLLDALRALGKRWDKMLTSAGAELRERPAPQAWSAIEYAAHSRDVTALHMYGVQQALTEQEPVFPEIADDVVESATTTYRDLDPHEVATELATQTTLLAQIAEDAGRSAWSRGLTVGETRSDVRRLLEHALHDSLHHLDDVERGLISLR